MKTIKETIIGIYKLFKFLKTIRRSETKGVTFNEK